MKSRQRGIVRFPQSIPPRFGHALAGFACSLLLTAPARAETHILHYTARLLGAGLLDIAYCIDAGPLRYTSAIEARTIGVVDLVWHGESRGFAEGGITDGRIRPEAYRERGKLGGESNNVEIGYAGGNPVLQAMTPPETKYRLPIPPASLAGSVDGLSAIVLEILTATRTKACQGSALVYDGFQLRRGTTHTAGSAPFVHGAHNIFSGEALRCDTVSEQLAGYLKNRAVAPQAKPRRSSVWLAPLGRDGLYLPLRLTFDADFLGDITVDLDKAELSAAACPDATGQ